MIPRLNLAEARDMLASGVASGGMIPKIEASLRALTTTQVVRIIDGEPPTLYSRTSPERPGKLNQEVPQLSQNNWQELEQKLFLRTIR